MHHEPDSLVRLKKNLEEMRPGKKPFPERNWHYITNLGLNFTVRSKAVNLRSPTSLTPKAGNKWSGLDDFRNSRTLGELNEMRKQLQLKDLQLQKLQQNLPRNSGVRLNLTRDSRSLSPAHASQPMYPANKKSVRVFQVPSASLKYAANPLPAVNRLYFTKKAPKPLANDPITGLPARSAVSEKGIDSQ